MVCILPILWILLLVRASDGENWEAGGFNSEDGEIADTFKMNNHGRPLSNPELYLRRSEQEIDGQDLSPRNAKVEVGINNHHDVPSKNDQKFFHMNNHGRPLSNPEKYFGRSKRDIIRSIGWQGFNYGNENTEAAKTYDQDTNFDENVNVFKMNNHRRPLSNPGIDGQGFNPGNKNNEIVRKNHQDEEKLNLFQMNNHGRPLSNPDRYFERSNRERIGKVVGQGFNLGNENLKASTKIPQDLPFEDNQNAFKINNHGRPLSNPDRYFVRSKRELTGKVFGQGFNPGNENLASLINIQQDLPFEEKASQINHHGRPLSNPDRYFEGFKQDIIGSIDERKFNHKFENTVKDSNQVLKESKEDQWTHWWTRF